MNLEMATVTYIVLLIFAIMAGYVIWFLSSDKDKILNNTQNRRQDLLAERVTKGKILSADGKVLAKTVKNLAGNEVREYPYDGLFAHVVGRTSHGRTGLEASESFTMLTSGITPMQGILNDLKGLKNPGNDVITTLHVNLSQIASDALEGRKGAVVVMEPSTGKVLTMVSKPSYNPNRVDENWDRLINDSSGNSSLYNRATQGLYPPGSTFKLYTLLEFMRENKNFSKFQYKCTGRIGTGDSVINCYGHEVHGTIGLKRAFAKSCNAAFAQISSQLDLTQWTKLTNSFFYNKSMPITEVEQKSAQFDLKDVAQGDVMQAGIGQGSVVTSPLQNILLVNAALNNGVLMKPYVMDHVSNTYGNVVKKIEPEEVSSPITEQEAKVLKNYMRETVQSGTATALQSSHYQAGGKTGSAQFKQGSSESHAWFVGYAKQGDRCITVSIIVEGAGTGGAHAVPIARRIFDAYF